MIDKGKYIIVEYSRLQSNIVDHSLKQSNMIDSCWSEKGEVLRRGVGTLRCCFPPNACAQWQPDDLTARTQKVSPGGRIPRSTSHFLFVDMFIYIYIYIYI